MSGVESRIPPLDLGPEIEEVWDELNEAFRRVLGGGQFILGPEVETFERDVAEYLGVKHAIGVNSGTDALVIGLRALGIGPGDEVITTPFTFFATGESISNVGATPVFVDVDARTFNLDCTLIEDAITPRTKALLPVHLYGRPCEMDAVVEIADRHRLAVIEDCAQSFGATHGSHQTGTIGDVGAYSFFPTKNLGGVGDGGLLVTDDDATAQTARMLRAHGGRRKYWNEAFGYNSRLDALQAALLSVKLRRIDAYNGGRRQVAHRYDGLLDKLPDCVRPDDHPGHVYHQYTVRIVGADRDEVRSRLADDGIGTMVYYPTPQNRLPVYADTQSFTPVSDTLANEVLSLPIGPYLDEHDQRRIVSALRHALEDRG